MVTPKTEKYFRIDLKMQSLKFKCRNGEGENVGEWETLTKKKTLLYLRASLCEFCAYLCVHSGYMDFTESHISQIRKHYFVKIFPKNIFISFQESLSAWGLYSIGILNFLPIAVASGLVNA
jgi:hypothetical protein